MNVKHETVRSVLAAAFALLILLLIVPAAGCDSKDADFEQRYQALLDSAEKEEDKPAATQRATPAPTQAPTPKPLPTTADVPSPPPDATIDIQAAFTQSAYPSAVRSAAHFDSGEAFAIALKDTQQWVFRETTANPDATMFNGGYLDMGEVDTSVYLPAYEFFDSEAYYIELDPDSYMTTYEQNDSYYIQQIGGVWYACVEMGQRVTYAGIGFKLLVTMFITDTGDLVERISMYDAHTETLFHISYDNVYAPESDMAVDTAGLIKDHPPMQWLRGDFENALMQTTWMYIAGEPTTQDIIVPGYEDISIPTIDYLTFEYDGRLYVTQTDTQTGEIDNEYSFEYIVDDGYAYAYITDYNLMDELYELDIHFYIDESGLLIETVRLYDHNTGTYSLASGSANIYQSYEP